MRVELVTECAHGMMIAHNAIRLDDGSVIGDTPCPGGSRSTVSGFSPEAVQAAGGIEVQNPDPEEGGGMALAHLIGEERVAAALAAAWATDFGTPT